MNSKRTNPQANVPAQRDDEPAGDGGRADRTWMPPSGEQGISNRPDDELGAADDDGEDVAATSEDENADDFEKAEDDKEDDEDDDDEGDGAEDDDAD